MEMILKRKPKELWLPMGYGLCGFKVFLNILYIRNVYAKTGLEGL